MNEKIFGIAYECPFKIRKDNCPVNLIKLLSFKEKVGWIVLQNNEDIQTIIRQHDCCSKRREQKIYDEGCRLKIGT